jgi:hypothetical protein
MIEITKRGRFTELIVILLRSPGFVIRAPTNSNHVLLIVLVKQHVQLLVFPDILACAYLKF